LVAAGVLLSACQTTTIRDSWADPEYRGGPVKKVLVVAVSRNDANRRILEDIVVGKLNVAGADAAPSYRFVPESGPAPEPELDNAVRDFGADALLMIRLRRVQTRTEVSTMVVPAPGWYGWYSGWYGVPDVRQYDIATVETTLFSTATKRLVWTGVTETFAPTSVANDAPGYADVVIGALRARGLLPQAK
jgi:hypothetical protein